MTRHTTSTQHYDKLEKIITRLRANGLSWAQVARKTGLSVNQARYVAYDRYHRPYTPQPRCEKRAAAQNAYVKRIRAEFRAKGTNRDMYNYIRKHVIEQARGQNTDPLEALVKENLASEQERRIYNALRKNYT